MTEIGERLQAAREALGLSLQDAERTTRIRAKYLAALESGDLARLPGDVYARLFLRSYADYLGLESAPLLDLLGYTTQQIPEPGSSLGHWLSEPLLTTPLPLASILTPAIMLLVLGALAFSAWWVYPRRGELASFLPMAPTATSSLLGLSEAVGPSLGIATLATTTPTPIFRPTTSPNATATATPIPTATTSPRVETDNPLLETMTPITSPTAGSSPTSSKEVRLALQATEAAWVWVKVDGEQVFMGTLQNGERREWVGKQNVFMRAGNAGGVKVILNGQPQEAVGAPGQVVNITWALDPKGGPPIITTDAPALAPNTTG